MLVLGRAARLWHRFAPLVVADFRREYRIGWQELLALEAVEFAVLAMQLSPQSRTAYAAATAPSEAASGPRSVEDLAAVMARHRGDFEDVRNRGEEPAQRSGGNPS